MTTLRSSDFPISQAESESRLEHLKFRYFNSPHIVAADSPCAIYVAGQPASGKSTIIDTFGQGFVVLDSDELRKFHPALPEIMKKDPLRMDVLSNGPVGQWMGGLIKHARLHGHNVIIENTLSNPEFIAEEIKAFRAHGFTISIAAMAVAAPVSRLGVVDRYVRASQFSPYPRWTSELSHSNGYKALVPGLKALAPLTDEVTIFTRDMQKIEMDEIEHERATWFDNPNHREAFLTRFEELELTDHLKEQSLTQNLLADVEKIRSWI